jgi:hypothetical protein
MVIDPYVTLERALIRHGLSDYSASVLKPHISVGFNGNRHIVTRIAKCHYSQTKTHRRFSALADIVLPDEQRTARVRYVWKQDLGTLKYTATLNGKRAIN